MASYFKNVKDAKVFGKGRYFVPGTFALKLKRADVIESKNPKTMGQPIFVAEFEILDFVGTTYTNVAGNVVDTSLDYKAGDSISQTANLVSQYGPADCKKVGMALYAEQDPSADEAEVEANVGEEFLELLISAEQPLAGTRVHVECWNHVTRSTGKDFGATKWSALSKSPLAGKFDDSVAA